MIERPPSSPDLLPVQRGDRPPGSDPAVTPTPSTADAGIGLATTGPRRWARLAVSLATTAAVLGFAGWALVSVQGAAVAVRADLVRAAWLLPWLVALHLGQLLLSATAWRGLLPPRPLPAGPLPSSLSLPQRPPALPSPALFWRLRIVREGIDSLLPVAQVGGEIVAARLLRRLGVSAPRADASIVVDVTLELLTQVMFLAAGLLALAALPGGAPTQPDAADAGWAPTAWLLPAVGGLAALLVLAQRFGALRGLELVARAVSRHVPGLADLAGLQAEAQAIYRRGPALRRAAALHAVAWLLGTVETWAVLHALGLGASPMQALVVESLGMAARSAGFALPGAIGVQEGGFILAVAAAGLPGVAACLPHVAACAHVALPGPGALAQLGANSTGPVSAGVVVGLALSLLKRLREIGTGTVGLALWRWRWPVPRPS
jgi:hypothetical protein